MTNDTRGSGAQLAELYSWAGGEGVFIEAVVYTEIAILTYFES